MEATATKPKSKDFTSSIIVRVSPAEAAEKIGRVSEWWAKNTEGRSNTLGDTFTVRWGETFVTFQITEANPNKRVVWHVTDCMLPWQNDKTEWTGTDVIFEISPEGT